MIEPSEDGPIVVLAVAGISPLLSSADVGVEPSADAVALALARILLASSGEIVEVLMEVEIVLLPLSTVVEPESLDPESEPELEILDAEPVIARLLRSCGELSMKAIVGPATMLPMKRSRGLLINGCVSFVT